jgi:fructokinase
LSSGQIWVAGEALIDLIHSGSKFLPIVGGGPANTAKAISKLGLDIQFISSISTDMYGEMIIDELKSYGVKCDYINKSSKPTATTRV